MEGGVGGVVRPPQIPPRSVPPHRGFVCPMPRWHHCDPKCKCSVENGQSVVVQDGVTIPIMWLRVLRANRQVSILMSCEVLLMITVFLISTRTG